MAKVHANTENARLVLKYIFNEDIAEMTAAYNAAYDDTLSVYTVQRYTDSGKGYEDGPPGQFVRFVRLVLETRLRK